MSNLKITSLFLAFAGILAAQTAPMVHTDKVGTLRVTTLQDGEMALPASLLKGIEAAEAVRLIGGETEKTPDNAFLVRYGTSVVLVDTCATTAMNPSMGNLQARLKTAGVAPEEVQAVLITHFHGDHLGGLLTPDGKRAFPKAVLRVAKAENDYWLDPATEAKLPEARRPMIAQIKAAIAPYQAEGAYKPFAPGEAPFPGVEAIPAYGHTPGHTVYAFGPKGQAFWAVGDIAHFGLIQFQHPEAVVGFDWDNTKAAAARLDLWKRAAKEHAVIGAAHIFPGVGHIKAKGAAFEWVPLI